MNFGEELTNTLNITFIDFGVSFNVFGEALTEILQVSLETGLLLTERVDLRDTKYNPLWMHHTCEQRPTFADPSVQCSSTSRIEAMMLRGSRPFRSCVCPSSNPSERTTLRLAMFEHWPDLLILLGQFTRNEMLHGK